MVCGEAWNEGNNRWHFATSSEIEPEAVPLLWYFILCLPRPVLFIKSKPGDPPNGGAGSATEPAVLLVSIPVKVIVI